jgi:hypothetical protein
VLGAEQLALDRQGLAVQVRRLFQRALVVREDARIGEGAGGAGVALAEDFAAAVQGRDDCE